ncbi:MAG: 4-(cytidine 5'-diphospho)-2-C-methyl-D-erythritol kinase [Bacteroidota bacterium]|nr:4-(cytidine 5'-diphospho)-2-C-methyl-D-erythritol kinase [Bacteroidota bacterium]
MILYPSSKINLGLYVVSRRKDGFHSIQTLFYPLGLRDILEFVPITDNESEADSLSLSGLEIPGSMDDNLLLIACKLFREQVAVPYFRIHLHKRIPMGAGLGGGSSDAVFLLRGLNSKYGDLLSRKELGAIALKLGSDCPYFLCSGPSLGKGRGELLESFEMRLAGYHFYLFSPGVHVSTKAAYRGVELYSGETHLEQVLEGKPESWRGKLINSFESTVFRQFPEIAELKKEIYDSGAVYASMSGSGSAVYGLYTDSQELPDGLKSQLIWTEVLQ